MRRWPVEFGLSGLLVALAVLTAVVPDWVEVVFKVDPDAGSGALEWGVVALFALLSLGAAIVGRRDYKAAVDAT